MSSELTRSRARHVALWGWHLAAFEAADVGNTELVALLWQAAPIATNQANVVTDTSELALLSMTINNDPHSPMLSA